ncbi:MAG TPA: SRPBCC domain-containing protein [Fimbriimonadaceae bacterium]|nr:SRPBCC domain-containing protein [Fimbriimonadaceae bacterium]
MKDRIQLEAQYPHPPERVWEALTTTQALGTWLMPTDFKPLIGYRFRFERAEGSPVRGKVTDVEANRLLAYTWRDEDEGESSLVVWTLEPTDGGTRLRLEHLPIEEPIVTCLAVDNYFNWEYALRHGLPGMLRLLAGLESGRPRAPIVYVQEEVAR